jgi:hypothetical protein
MTEPEPEPADPEPEPEPADPEPEPEPDPELTQPAVRPRGPAPAAHTGGEAGALLNDVRGRWNLVKQVCKQKSRSVAALLHSARPADVEPGEQLTVVLAADYQFHLDKLREAASKTAVEWAFTQVLERPVRVRVVLNSSGNGGRSGNGGSSNGGGRGPARPAPSGLNGGGAAGLAERPAPGPHTPEPEPEPNLDDSWPDEPVASNVRPFTGSRAAANGYAYTQAPAPAAVAHVEQRTPANVTPIRPDAYAPAAPASTPSPALAPDVAALEAVVRADAVIQALLKTRSVELADVRPLDADDDS